MSDILMCYGIYVEVIHSSNDVETFKYYYVLYFAIV